MIAGSVGGGGRQTYSLYGDTVNISARLEALNKEHGTQLLIDGATAERIPDFPMCEIGRISLRGFSEPTPVFTPVAGSNAALFPRPGTSPPLYHGGAVDET